VFYNICDTADLFPKTLIHSDKVECIQTKTYSNVEIKQIDGKSLKLTSVQN